VDNDKKVSDDGSDLNLPIEESRRIFEGLEAQQWQIG